ncbi:hypothetical protein HW532_20805 [Kaustia mangrovi]|uniref:Uncharacterized protein n=1 Tax=Kaustia mangrovi TaxID=2593653 RepID=A0A7S8C7P0_9HYPH|nr:hypothetical protein [Kaustia mangrovi]QPC44920.1 hypothetical protein HW532_20805 [Kaustia mangrovi]
MKPNVTIRFGAQHNDITVDGVTFDRDQLKREKKLAYVSGVIRRALYSAGYFPKDNRKPSRHRKPARLAA